MLKTDFSNILQNHLCIPAKFKGNLDLQTHAKCNNIYGVFDMATHQTFSHSGRKHIRLLVLVYLIIRNKWKSAVISVKVGLSTSNCVGGELESGSWRPLHFFLLFFPTSLLLFSFTVLSLPAVIDLFLLRFPSMLLFPVPVTFHTFLLWYRGYCQACGRVCKGCVDQREHRLRKARGSVTGEEAMWGE